MTDNRDRLIEVFGAEWEKLSAAQSAMVSMDFAIAEAECTTVEYARRIGAGNLESYAEALIAGQSRKVLTDRERWLVDDVTELAGKLSTLWNAAEYDINPQMSRADILAELHDIASELTDAVASYAQHARDDVIEAALAR